MTVIGMVRQLVRGLRNRLAVRSLDALDDRHLADIGLLRSDVREALCRSLLSDPSRALKAVCCHWRTYIAARPMPGAAVCCE